MIAQIRRQAVRPGLNGSWSFLCISASVLVACWRSPALAESTLPADPGASSGVAAGPVLFSPSINLQLQYSDNVFRSGPPETQAPVASWLTQLNPSLTVLLPYSHSHLTLQYSPQIRNYSGISLPVKIAHQISLKNELFTSNDMVLETDAAYLRGVLETNEIDPSQQIRFTTTPYEERSGGLTWTWKHPSRWGTALVVKSDQVKFLDTQSTVSSSNLRSGLFDYRGQSAGLDGTWELRKDLYFFWGVQEARTYQTLTGDDAPDADGNFNGVLDPEEVGFSGSGRRLTRKETLNETDWRLGVRGPFGPRLSGEVRIASTNLKSSLSGTKPFNGLTYAAKIECRSGQYSTLNLEFERRPLHSLANQGDVFLFRTVVLNWVVSPNRRDSWFMGARYQIATFSNGLDQKTIVYTGGWDRPLSRMVRVESKFFRTVRTSTGGGVDFDENTATLGLTMGWF